MRNRSELQKFVRKAGVVLLFGLACASVRAQNSSTDLTSRSLEDLMNMEVISASKKSEALSKAPAAIYVVTGDAIRRGGFSSVPDALRMVPGLYVVQQSAHVWLVSARGFSNAFNDKMLVLIDGRVVYTPTFGGVNWDVQDPPLEDIDRIEVIRGPGGALWGANAVNGVINIITKSASRTQGEQVSTSAGINEGYAARLRYGGTAGNFGYRVYGTSNYWLPTASTGGGRSFDAWTISQSGARFDWKISPRDSLTFDGEGYSGRVRDVAQIFTPTAPPRPANLVTVTKGGHILGNWKHTFSERSSTEILAYCDWSDRFVLLGTENRTTCDAELQHNIALTDRQALTLGGGIMTTAHTFLPTFTVSFSPTSNRYTNYSGFVQYDLVLVPGMLRVIAGSKLEHNDYSGFQYQPQIRAVWTPNDSNTLWAAVSRAVRTPTRSDESIRERFAQTNPTPPPLTFLFVEGGPGAKSEIVHSFELGYRFAWRQKFTADAAVFYNDYNQLTGLGAMGTPIVHSSPVFVDIPLFIANLGAGQTHGLELSLNYAPVRRWTVSTSLTELRGTSTPAAGFPAASQNPKQQIAIQSRLDLTRHFNLDAAWYHYNAIADSLPLVNRADVGASTNPIHGFSFSVWGRNLQADRHVEAIPQTFLAGEIRRSLVFKIVWDPRDPPAPPR